MGVLETALAEALLGKMLDHTERALRKQIQGSERAQALARSLEAGIAAMIAHVDTEDVEMKNHAEAVFREYFADSDVAREMEKLLHPGQEPALSELKSLFLEIGDPAQLPFDSLDQALIDLIAGYTEATRQETALQQEIIVKTQASMLAGQQAAGTAVSETVWETHYLQTLVEWCASLDLAQIDLSRAAASVDSVDGTIHVEDVFTTLYVDKFTRHPRQSVSEAISGKAESRAGMKEEERVPIQVVEAIGAMDRLVVLGHPGGGKSTLVNYLAVQLAAHRLSDQQDARQKELLPGWNLALRPLPVRIVLRRFAAWMPADTRRGEAKHVWDYLEYLLDRWGCPQSFTPLRNELIEQGGAIFFDGLDEVSESDEAAKRTLIKEAIEAFSAPLTRCKIVVTCREYAYQFKEKKDEQDSWVLPRNRFPVVNLALFDLDQIRAFNHAWYGTVGLFLDWPEDKRSVEADRLSDAIAVHDHLRELAKYPLLLTLMAQLHGRDGYLPEDRADLYHRSLDLLLSLWDNRLIRDTEGGKSVEQGLVMRLGIRTETLRALLAEVAFKAHERQELEPSRSEQAANLSREELRQAIYAEVKDWNKAEEAMDFIQHRAGLLVARDNYTYAFPHRTYQEYLAAWHVLQQPDPAALLRARVKRDLEWWREVYLLAAGVSRIPMIVNAMVNELLPYAPAPERLSPAVIEYARLAAQALWESGFEKHVKKEQEEGPGRYSATFERIQQWLLAGMRATEKLEARARADAGRTLSRLGDPRQEVLRCEAMRFCHIPAGSFLMGSSDVDKQAKAREKPQHRVNLTYDYWIGTFPVTVAQFRQFVAESEMQPRIARSIEGPANHPVVHVTWHDAMNFCRWFTSYLREIAPEKLEVPLDEQERVLWERLAREELKVTLPGEAEWEKATRGMKDAHIYPWGDTWDVNKCNNWEAGIRSTSAVGCFPNGKHPDLLVEEMVGNVWEWSRDRYDKDLYQQRNGAEVTNPNGPKSGSARVLRGGSFSYDRGFCRCAARFVNHYPYDYSYDVGFRVVVLPSTMSDEPDAKRAS